MAFRGIDVPTPRKSSCSSLLASLAGLFLLPFFSAGTQAGTCPVPGPAVQRIATSSVYSDPHGSVVDPEKLEKNRAERTELNRYLQMITEGADEFVSNGDRSARQCVIRLLEAWAADDALLRGSFSWQGSAVRAWAVGTLGFAALKIGAPAEPLPPAVIAWMTKLGRAVEAFGEERRMRFGEGRTNISYWVASSLGVLGVVLARNDFWEKAHQGYTSAVRAIAPDGTLSAELQRRSRACLYHAFAAEPLVALRRLAELRGQNWAVEGDGRLERLIEVVLGCAADARLLSRQAGVAQIKLRPQAWFRLYRPAGSPPEPRHGTALPQSSLRLGGRVDLLDAVLSRH
jgi:poly(beta-D-mannuronate) lyase